MKTSLVAPGPMPTIAFCPATPGDFRATWYVFTQAAAHLAQTRGWLAVDRPATPPERFLAFPVSAVRHDPGAPGVGALERIDRATLGIARPEDHAFWGSGSSLRAFAVVRDGRTVGYAYVQSDGAIGPIAVLDPADLAPAVEASIGAVSGLGAKTARARISGGARPTIERLLARRWRYGDAVTLVLTSAPWGRWDRYVTSGADALL